MFTHDLVEGVTVEARHEDEDHAGGLPPAVVSLALGEEELGWEGDGHWLPCSWSFEPNGFSDNIPE